MEQILILASTSKLGLIKILLFVCRGMQHIDNFYFTGEPITCYYARLAGLEPMTPRQHAGAITNRSVIPFK